MLPVGGIPSRPDIKARYRTTDETAIVGESLAGLFVIETFLLQPDSVRANAPQGLKWHYEPMPQEKHSTIYHPAALQAFRAVFKP